MQRERERGKFWFEKRETQMGNYKSRRAKRGNWRKARWEIWKSRSGKQENSEIINYGT